MNWANPALYVAIASLVTAIGGVIALFRRTSPARIQAAVRKTPQA